MADGIDLDAALDELFATPPEGFTTARNALAKALKGDKRKEEADEVTALRKPGRLVWALNQLGLEEDDALEPLLEAAEDVRAGGGADFREAVADLRDAVSGAAAAAAKRLDPPRTTDRADLAQALLAIVADEDATTELEHGRMLDVPAPDAFGLGSSAPAAPKPKPKATAKPKPKGKAETAAERPPDQLAIRRADKRRKEAAKEADSAQRALARAEKALVADAEALERADTELAEANDVVEEAEAALADAKAQLEKAQAAAAKAVESQERTAATLADAKARADAADAQLEEAEAELEQVGSS